MRIHHLASVLLLALALPGQAAIFGPDDRQPLPPGSSHYEASRSVALAILSANFSETSPGKLKLEAGKMSDFVCPEEKFAGDPSMSYACTGFLVGPDLIATAGHCMVNTGESRNETETYCQAYAWLFDYRNDASGGVKLSDVPADRLYRCKQVVYAVKDEDAPYRDFALVQLDREVKDRKPLKLSTAPAAGPFHMIGHPLGAPLKLSRGSRVLLDDPTRGSFLTNLDAFEGNSGSPVFNARNEVVGILVGGTPSRSLFEPEGRTCSAYNRCREDGTGCSLPDKDTSSLIGYMGVGSEVHRIAPVLKLIEEFQR